MKKGLLAVVLPLTLSLGGCVIVAGTGDWSSGGWEEKQKENRFQISQLTVGADRSSVIETLGKPDFSESFTHQNKVYQVYYYRTQKTKGDGKTTKDETTPVVFVGNSLMGWGQQALDQALQVSEN